MRRFHFHRWFAILVATLLAFLAAAPAAAAPNDLSGAIAAVEPSVVRIDTTVDYQHVMGTGTGIVLDPNGQVLTNYHVIQGADTINAMVGGRPFAADIVGFDRRRDIAVIQLRGAGGLPVTPLGDSAQLSIGDPVVALGNARGTGAPLTQETGTISAFGRTISAADELTGSSNQMTGLFEIAAPVRAGDSGGPVVNGADRSSASHGRLGELQDGPRRRRVRDPDQRRVGDRQPDPRGHSVGHRAHRTADTAGGRREYGRAT